MGCWESKSRLAEESSSSEYQNQNLSALQKSSSPPQTEKSHTFETDYEVIGQLFSNPQKNVKKIVHKASGKVLCLRIIKKDSISDKESRNLNRQFEILKALDHPNIIRLIDHFNHGLSCYMVTEFCNGGELFDKVVTQMYLQEKQAMEIMEQLLSAVEFCHKKNIVHRDIKPENILFESESPDSLIKLTDFKHAKFLKPNKRMKKKFGGVFYLSPEVIKGNYTEKCDIWACGVILYIILCGYPPFSGTTDEKIEERILIGEISFKGSEWKDVSNEGKEFIKRLLEYDEAKRVSAEEALKDDWFKLHKRKKSSLNNNNPRKSVVLIDPAEIKRIIFEYIENNQKIHEDNQRLRLIFESFDKDTDYHLPYESLVKSFESFKEGNNNDFTWIDNLLDSFQKDSINYNEILMVIYNKRIALNKENFERSLHSINKNEKGVVLVEDLLLELKKQPMENEEWTNIVLELQNKSKGEELLLKNLKENLVMKNLG